MIFPNSAPFNIGYQDFYFGASYLSTHLFSNEISEIIYFTRNLNKARSRILETYSSQNMANQLFLLKFSIKSFYKNNKASKL